MFKNIKDAAKSARSLLRWGRGVGRVSVKLSGRWVPRAAPRLLINALKTHRRVCMWHWISRRPLTAAHSQSHNEKAFWNQEEKPSLRHSLLQFHLLKSLMLSQLAEGKSYRAQLQSHKGGQRRMDLQWRNKLITCTTSI